MCPLVGGVSHELLGEPSVEVDHEVPWLEFGKNVVKMKWTINAIE